MIMRTRRDTNLLQAEVQRQLAAADAWARDVRATFTRATREGRTPSHDELMQLIDSDPRPATQRESL